MTHDATSPVSIHDLVDELTRRHTHRERYAVRGDDGSWWTRNHLTTVPSLIDQLQTATPSGSSDGGVAAGGFKSRPAAWLEGIDTLARIDLEAARWVRDLGEDDDSTNTAVILRRLHGLWPSTTRCHRQTARRDPKGKVTCCTSHAIEVDVRRWWTQARIITGWDTSPWRPANTCPACGTRGKLRIRLSAQAAFCVECRATWDSSVIGVLAEHIRTENADPETPTATAS